jgi:dipeptidyl aminopeptidase/acylaminoacyl peptidase
MLGPMGTATARGRETAPFGSWRSSLTSELLVRGGLSLSQPRLDGGELHWVEGRPGEGGRQVVVRARGRGIEDLSPPGVSVRSRVHEYGGGDYLVRRGVLFFVDFAEPGIFRREAHGVSRVRGTLPAARYADFELSPDGRWLACVEEELRPGVEPANRLVALELASGERRVVEVAFDFVSFPRFAPDGRALAYTAWRHPDMPWDATELRVLGWRPDGPASAPRTLAGGPGESIFQPGFSPGGRLTFVSDRSGWWNLEQLRGDERVPLCPRPAEFGLAQWVFGLSTWDFVDERTILCSFGSAGTHRLARLDVESGALRELALPYSEFQGLRVEGRSACFLGASATRPVSVCRLDLADGRVEEPRSSFALELEEGLVAEPEAIEFASGDGRRAHAFAYAPRNPGYAGPRGERPLLLVKSHGGPTSASLPSLQLAIQYWTSRGFAVVDVNYGGSTGYGRDYRNLLRGQWGVVDVEDCAAAARHLAGAGLADPRRLCISGGSAGGYTTLCALTFYSLFAAGASHYGVGDLEALARDTHKFESRYLDRLVGPYPERRDLYVARSPIHHVERLACPVAFFQGLEDRVVPPSQAEAMVAALAARGIPHAYVAFPGEQHGFRRAENIRTALDGELFFYAQVFGFDVEPKPEAARLRRAATGADTA